MKKGKKFVPEAVSEAVIDRHVRVASWLARNGTAQVELAGLTLWYVGKAGLNKVVNLVKFSAEQAKSDLAKIRKPATQEADPAIA